MDYFTVNQIAFLSATLATIVLVLILMLQSFRDHWKRLLAVGVVGQLIWSVALFSDYSFNILNTTQLLFVEHIRFTLWHVTLVALLLNLTPFRNWNIKTKSLIPIMVIVNVISLIAIFTDRLISTAMLASAFAGLSVLGLILTEQIVRNTNSHRIIKILGLCLVMMFTFDTLVYGHNALNSSIPAFMWQTRAALALAIATSLSMGSIVFNVHSTSKNIFAISRPVVFYSSTLIFVGLIAVAFVISSLYFEKPGFLGSYLFTLALLAGLLLTLALVMSKQFRQRVDVFFSKHFFSLQYDYRQEWLSVTRSISDLNDLPTHEFYSETLRILCNAIKANSGSFWLHEGSALFEKASTFPALRAPDVIHNDAPFVKTMLKEGWIFAPNSDLESLAANNEQLPDWIKSNSEIWIVAPLTVQMKLVGIVIVKRPSNAGNVTFEDRDLMTNVSTQIANQIRLRQQEQTISEAKQLETYNRMASFIMHDTNNVIAQLALIGKNAEKHKKNPAFIDDMINTVENAVNRMKSLVQKFNPATDTKPERVCASIIAKAVVESVSDRSPTATLTIEDDFEIVIDKSKLILAIKNIVRNAQEASPKENPVKITIRDRKISVTDQGNGMSQSFMRENLFKPFSTTKSDKGIGIGAYLTKSFIEDAGATLRVESTEGKGSNFTITFPEEKQ